ncbi:MAG TPA: hypothetical protein VK631_09610 [Solirubrobacteraceae bacterium]|nr:hypothetical protein [Solirubrobacteraceae bacterium]
MAADGRGRVLIAWDAEDVIRWRFAHRGVTGRIETPAPGAPAAALDDRGGAVLAWGAFEDCKACTRGSVSFAARPPGRRAFKTSRRGASNVMSGPPTLALAPSGRAAWAWEGGPFLGIGNTPYAAPGLRLIPSRRIPSDVSLGWLDSGIWLATWMIWSGPQRPALVAGAGADTASLLRDRRRWLTLPTSPDFEPSCPRVATAPRGAQLAAWDHQRWRDGKLQRRIMLAGRQPDGTPIAPRPVTRWAAPDRVACPAVAMASDGWGAVAWLVGDFEDRRVRVATRPPGGSLGPSRTVARGERAAAIDVSVARGGGVLAVWAAAAGAGPVRAAMLGRRPRTLAASGTDPRAILQPDDTATVTWRAAQTAWMARRR